MPHIHHLTTLRVKPACFGKEATSLEMNPITLPVMWLLRAKIVRHTVKLDSHLCCSSTTAKPRLLNCTLSLISACVPTRISMLPSAMPALIWSKRVRSVFLPHLTLHHITFPAQRRLDIMLPCDAYLAMNAVTRSFRPSVWILARHWAGLAGQIHVVYARYTQWPQTRPGSMAGPPRGAPWHACCR